MNTPPRTLGLLAACLLAPLTVFTIGDWMGAGLRFPLVLYQDTIHGISWIPLWREITYVTSGLIGGRSALAILLWTLGTLLLIAAACLLIVRWYEKGQRPVALLLAGAGAAFLLSCVAHYGPLFHGPAGVCVPVGVPLVFAAAWFVWRGEDGEDESTSPDSS
ncbi:hypothetical protein [Methanofollis tationis]|uniref:Uncharacterized protein n=1 Tax=Methanofollis tationis TaxID=81417 RepID=A0A7K4HR60_9EURY|nr:hypothetical protein [Methanofollis tationis]NVO67773.1 hypothetical protein [Methanofollis tationis]